MFAIVHVLCRGPIKEKQTLCDVAKTILILPHSNAGEERVVSLKTAFRPSLQVNGTLASLLTIKMANKQPSFEPPTDLLTSAKKAWNYNKEHLTRGSE